MNRVLLVIFFALFSGLPVQAQKNNKNKNPVYVDKSGVLRWTKDKSEAAFFGVNYTTPFAYAYRAQRALHVDLKKAIQQDVYHMARLGLDAFRVHVWDTEISDTLGNLSDNEHLQLFDFLLAELKKRDIRVIITPIAFWGNGYPEKDEDTPGFSRKYGKDKATVAEAAIKAQENYLQQFFRHVNPYTRLTYGNDPNIIAVEINNEPSHSGPKSGVTNYINRMAGAIRSTGWTKPLYYNISQSPYYADAVAQSAVDGVSFQWYPAGLVAGHEIKGNFLPHVDRYTIPYDTIPAFRNKSLMVYEFDAADNMQSCMYPAMARSFRQAGFQWATQFAYDPMALAYANTEYQTHYLNLAYTPSKAISLLIAAKAFHKIPRHENFSTYPSDSSFGPFRVSYRESLSEMSDEQEFYYSNSTGTTPKSVGQLMHIAGTGSSLIVQYSGTGAYFLDKVDNGAWRLEVMPDAVPVRDPFAKASPEKEVTRIVWGGQTMNILLPDLGDNFSIRGLNEGNDLNTSAGGTRFIITPGTYLLTGKDSDKAVPEKVKMKNIEMNEFVAPHPFSAPPVVTHTPFRDVSAGRSFHIDATIVGTGPEDKMTLQINKLGGSFREFKMIAMTKGSAYRYTAEVPAELVTPGALQYRIIVRSAAGEYVVFPGGHKGDPFAWDNTNDETWQTFVVDSRGDLEIFNPTHDRNIAVYPPFKKGFQTGYTAGQTPGQLIYRMEANEFSKQDIMGFQFYFADKTKGRSSEKFDELTIKARTGGNTPVKATVTLTDKNGFAYSSVVMLTDTFRNIEIPFARFLPDSSLLLPRPYPGFIPLWSANTPDYSLLNFSDCERIQVVVEAASLEESEKSVSIEVASIAAKKINP